MTETHFNCDKTKKYCKLRIWSHKVIKRDKHCQRCGATSNLDVHHIQKTGKYDKHYFDVDYGVCLCKECHRKFHDGIKGCFTRENTLKFLNGSKNWNKVIR